MTALLWLVADASAVRPTEGGLFAFAADDEVATYDEPSGRLRIHYAAAGPSVVDLADVDGTGVPDYVELAASMGTMALDRYAELGFRMPLNESDLGLGALGGSDALDVYLVDFEGNADGAYGVDTCTSVPPVHCSGYLSVENDFRGYGYPSDEVALQVVVPHELFHGVQMAYTGELDVWGSEGTATWAVRLFDEESEDFLRFAQEYLLEPTRSIDDPPVGPVPSFAYGTALWFDFLTLRHDDGLVVELLEAWESEPDQALAMVEALEPRGDTIEDAWLQFAEHNLALGEQSGELDGYPYADLLDPVALEDNGDLLDDDNRFYPLATTYYRLNHRGGELWFGLEAPAPELWFSVHPTLDGTRDAPVLEAVTAFWGDDAGPRSLGELPEGQYFVWGAQPRLADDSVKVRFCAGAEADVAACFGLPPTDEPVDTGAEGGGGCGCESGAAGGGSLGIGLLAVLWRRRR